MSILPTAYTEDACREAAKQARLRYVKDSDPGITRKRHGKGFTYLAPEGERITNEDVLERIRSLAIPPAYRSVWICPLPNGHLQATGRDERRRKQYRYHPEWEAIRTQTKFAQLAEFAEALPALRACIASDMAKPGLPRERVLATIVHLMDTIGIRIGNAQYAAENKTYGLTTLRKNHVEVEGNHITFAFTGKSGKEWQRDIKSRKVANIIRQCEELPGQQLFKYIDEQGERHPIASDDVNAYLQEVTGKPFTAKDFRTWAATAQAIELLGSLEHAPTKKETKSQLNAAIKSIAETLGHTPTICRKSYIHPDVLTCYESGTLYEWFAAQPQSGDHALVTAFLSR